MGKKFKKYIYMAIMVIIAIHIISEYKSEMINDEIKETVLDQSLSEIMNNIDVSDAVEVEYNRDEYTSSYQYYECESGHEYTSIRNYDFYESQSYLENGYYIDPYTNEEIDIEDCDYDHVIPLAYVEQHGGYEWTEEKKKEFADDPNNGVCVNNSDNRIKGAKGPSEWLPEENVENYCYTWLVIADKWNISLSQEDMNTIIETLDHCDVENLYAISY